MNTPEIVQRFTLTQQAAELIGRKIADGTYKEGDRIDPETLLRENNVSRTVFRESVRLLEGKGLITARPQTGTRVNPHAMWNIIDPDVTRWLTPDNEGRIFQEDAATFQHYLDNGSPLDDNVFYQKAYAAVIAIQNGGSE